MLRRSPFYAALLSGCLLGGRGRAAEADGTPPLAFEAALRVGIAAPFKLGRFGSPPIEAIAVAVPLRLELGARTGHLFFGAVAQYAFAGNGGECAEQASCSSRVLTAGPELLWFFDPSRLPSVWVGVSGGWQSITTYIDYGTSVSAITDAGWFIEPQAGLDLTRGAFHLGLWMGFTLGAVHDGCCDNSLHGWLSGGARLGLAL